MTASTVIIGTLLLVLFGSGLHVGLSLAGVGVIGLEFLRGLGTAVGPALYNTANSFIMAAVPMFLLLGQLLLHSGLSRMLYRGVSKWTRVLPGGLLLSNVLACSIFAAVSGSSPATAATIGTIAYGEQKERGYDASLITGSLAAGGTLGILIPPSINMIVYGAFVGASVGQLFAAGVLPGIMLALMFMLYISIACIRNPRLAPVPEPLTRQYIPEAIKAWKDVLPTAAMIVVILGSIYGGIMTPTEAAGVAAFLALVLGLSVGKMKLAAVRESAVGAVKTTSMVLLLFIGANLLGYSLGLLRIPRLLAEAVVALGLSTDAMLLAVVVFYLILGCFMDSLAMLLITLPVTFPIMVTTYGFDPIWFGIVLVVLCEIGMITPPVGINLFVIQGIAPREDVRTIVRGVVPFFVMLLLAIVVLRYLPDIALFLPRHMLAGP